MLEKCIQLPLNSAQIRSLSCRKILGSQNYIALTVAVEHDGSMPASREVAPLPGDRSARAGSASL